MDKSSGIEKNIIRMRHKNKISASVFFLSLIIFLFSYLNVFSEEISNFHVTAKDLDLLSFKSLLENRSPGIKYEGKISLSADVKWEEGVESVSGGAFSSDKISFSSGNSLFPIEFSRLEGEFTLNVKENLPVLSGKIRSSSVKWGKLVAQKFEADYELYEKKLIIKNGEIKVADGTAHVSGDIDFSKNPAFFNLKLTANDVNIGIIAERGGYERPVSGILFADADLSGEFSKPAGVFGKAKINIDKGELGKIGLVGRIITLSPLAAMSRDFSLNDFEGNFNISEGYAYTDDAVLAGPEIRITAKGEVGWNRKLNFLLGLYASSELLKGTSITRTLGVLIDDFGNVLRRIRVSGTIENPSFTILPLGIGSAIIEGLERSFQKGQEGEEIK
ncbi:MAG: AsmA-like C-terminal region-containing protein [Candidatus Ratteibacteria bacterium]|nr:AsmA-like C-terminal region-containing protein [Candidatus Ratteibacteria bacterium]